jgi:hypothetical protein
MSSARQLLPWVWSGLIGVIVVLFAVLATPEFEGPESVFVSIFLASVLAITALGSVVTARRPGNRIAWLLHIIAASLLFNFWASTLLEGGRPVSLGIAEWLAAAVGTPAAFTSMFSIVLLLYVFPTGQFLTSRWKWAGWVAAVLVSATWIFSLFATEVGDVWDEDAWTITNPIGVLPIEALSVLISVVLPILLATLVGGVASIVVRFRRSDLLVRTQIKWVLFASVVTLFSSFFAFAELGLVSDFLTMVVLNAIPVAVALAVVRYKLFEIDRLISRSISYGIVAFLLGALFAAGAIWVPTRLLGDQTPIFVASTTLGVAALFNPLRTRIQRGVDKRFNRTRYQAERVAEEFSAQLQESLTVQQLADIWARTVDTHFQPTVSGISLSPPKGKEPAP